MLQLNIWHQGTQISDGIATIADIVEETEADIVMLSEAGPAADSIRRELNRRRPRHLQQILHGRRNHLPVPHHRVVGG